MAFVKEDVFAEPPRPLKESVVVLVRGFLDRYRIPTTRTIAKVYTIDLVREIEKEMGPLTDEQVRLGLEYLVEEGHKLLESQARVRARS